MSGRNWTRRSIEELVEAYLRAHVKGGDTPTEPGDILTLGGYYAGVDAGSYDPSSAGSIQAGYLNLSGVTAGNATYYNPRTGANANFISIRDCVRYVTPTGASQEQGHIRTGFFVDSKYPKAVFTFTMVTVPKTCNPANIKAIYAPVCVPNMPDGANLYKGMAIVTTDPLNEYAAGADQCVVEKTIYYHYNIRNVSMSSIIATANYDMPVAFPSSTQYKYANFDANYRTAATEAPQFYTGNKIVRFSGGSMSSSAAGAKMFNHIKNYLYDGKITYSDSTVHDLNYMTLITISGGNTPNGYTNDDFERHIFALSRWFTDGNDIVSNQLSSGIPLIIKDSPQYNTDLPSLRSSVPNQTIRYKRKIVYV